MAAVRSLVAAAVLTASAVGVGLAVRGGDADPERAAPTAPTPRGTPLAAYDTSQVVVARAAFCSGLVADTVAAALGADPQTSSSYGNGQRAEVADGVEDVAHEFSCTWVAADGTTARAWVFAPPITPERARGLARAATRTRGCDAVTDAPDYGSPSAATVCTTGSAVEASYRGLFGDAWLACSLTAPEAGTDRADLVDRTGRWCVAVAQAASRGAV